MPIPTTPANLEMPRRLLRDEAYDKIAAAILDGTFAPGSDLDDERLSQLIGVSRSPIRQALTKLAEVGLVDMAPNRWTRVAKPDPALFLAGVRIMSTLWALGAETALPRLTKADVAEFDERLAIVLELGRANDPLRAAELIEAVHEVFELFLVRSGNPLLKPTVERVQTQVAHIAHAGADDFDLASLGVLLNRVRTGVHDREISEISAALESFGQLAGDLLHRMTVQR